MIILFKNATLFVYYASVCILMLSDVMWYEKGLFFSFFPIMMIYHLVLLFPSIHRHYIYQVTERGFIRWKIIWQVLFHGAMTLHFPYIVLFLFVLKELKFVIEFAETRLSKIEESLYEKCPGYRIAHLHLNLFQDDMDNRFHANCFHTNRLYILESTVASRETQLGISNYREIRRRNKTPRAMTEEDEKMYKAAANQALLFSQRNYIVGYYVGLLCTISLFEHYTTFLLIMFNITTFLFTRSVVHDVLVDLSYGVISVFFALQRNNISSGIKTIW